MNHRFVFRSHHDLLAAALFALAAGGVLQAGPAAAQGATSPAVTTATGDPYKACTDGTSSEDRATCMKEAGAAKAEARRGQLTEPDAGYDRNALQRCDALPSAEKEPCRLRVLGAGTTSGSVAGGGVLREVVTQTPAPPEAGGASSDRPDAGRGGSGADATGPAPR